MTAKILDGTAVARAIKEEVAAEVAEYSKRGFTPGLAAVLVGDDPASHIYVSSKVKTCGELGIYSEKIELPESTTTEELLALVSRLNSRDEIDGILIQVPLPKQINTGKVLNAVDPSKDVDGFLAASLGRLALNEPGPRACTPAGIMELLDRYQIPIEGARAVVLGRSRTVGLPMALLLMHRNATVTICHSRTKNLPEVTREADILVAAIGRMAMVDASFIKPGAVVIDVGTSKITNREDLERFFGDNPKKRAAFEKQGSVLIGDVNPREAAELAGYLSPVPGGVGPLTIAMLMKNTLTAMKLRRAEAIKYMLKAGLTGSIAVGKTNVVAVLQELGCVVFDADKIAHQVMEPGREAYSDVVREFGTGILSEDGRIDRAKLGAVVFADESRRQLLNSIVHPRVKAEQDRLLREAEAADPNGIAIVDAALMIESGGYKRFDKLIVIHCDRETQVDRLMKRNNISREDAEQRVAAQMSSDEKRKYADYEIDTSGSYEDTRRRTIEVYEKLKQLQQGSKLV